MNKNVLTLGPFETGGTTGITGDLKTIQQWRCYGVGVATEIVATNSGGVHAIFSVPFEFIAQQLESVTADIAVHGAKLGAVRSVDSVKMIASLLGAFEFPVLLYDPALKCRDGGQRVPHDVVPAIRQYLLPKVSVLVVNAAEAALILGEAIDSDVAGMKAAAAALAELGPERVVVTGGHLDPRVVDVCFDKGRTNTVDSPRQKGTNVLGLGSAFSSSILAQLVKGVELGAAVGASKKFISKAMVHPFQVGKGEIHPLNLVVPI